MRPLIDAPLKHRLEAIKPPLLVILSSSSLLLTSLTLDIKASVDCLRRKCFKYDIAQLEVRSAGLVIDTLPHADYRRNAKPPDSIRFRLAYPKVSHFKAPT